ncbi:MAG: hypothetical protein LBK99_10915 [Opitutaceae bacterium]|nr:hypothetical protein [Opitutaceae bacterium]
MGERRSEAPKGSGPIHDPAHCSTAIATGRPERVASNPPSSERHTSSTWVVTQECR